MNLETFFLEQPREVQVFVEKLVTASWSNRDLDVEGEIKKRFGAKYSDEEIKLVELATRYALR